jgi:predicted RNA-binding protein YlqC (UPF0109 family)
VIGEEFMLTELVEQIVKKLVDKPESVSVKETNQENGTLISLRVAQEDLGKVIGKEGRTARSLRMLVQAASAKQNKRASLEILE